MTCCRTLPFSCRCGRVRPARPACLPGTTRRTWSVPRWRSARRRPCRGTSAHGWSSASSPSSGPPLRLVLAVETLLDGLDLGLQLDPARDVAEAVQDVLGGTLADRGVLVLEVPHDDPECRLAGPVVEAEQPLREPSL